LEREETRHLATGDMNLITAQTGLNKKKEVVMEKRTLKQKQDELRKKDREQKQIRERILGALKRLENERTESEKILQGINEKLTLNLGLYYLGEDTKEEIMRLESEKNSHQEFIKITYSLIKQGLLKLLCLGYINKGNPEPRG